MKKRILIACPTSSHKDYCLEEWVQKIVSIAKVYDEKLINIGVVIVDNSPTINNSWYIKEMFLKLLEKTERMLSLKDEEIF